MKVRLISACYFGPLISAPGYRLKSSILTDIYIAFAKAGIEIPFPQRELHLRLTNEQADIIANNKKKMVQQQK
jgi:small-conductance mechanosensitive channel